MWSRLADKIMHYFCVGTVLLAIGIVLHYGTHIFIADQFIIPSSSMYPTLMEGDRVIVDKTIMGARIYTNYDFKRGGQRLESIRLKGRRLLKHNDIVVFNFHRVGNWESGINFEINNVWCKRILGLPGDTLTIQNGIYHCNNYDYELGVVSEQRRIGQMPDSTLTSTSWQGTHHWTIKEMGPYYIPRSGDRIRLTPKEATLYRHIIRLETGQETTFDWGQGKVWIDGKETDHYTFKENYYFLGGDNATNSYDCRFLGVVPEDYIIGVVKMISYSKDKQTGRIRWDRICKSL